MAARVGIVLVSHSAALAEGTAELAGQVGGGTVTIATAGGTDDGRLGTSIDKVESAIRRADTGAGVVTVKTTDGSTIDGVAGTTGKALAATQGAVAEFWFDGANWWTA